MLKKLAIATMALMLGAVMLTPVRVLAHDDDIRFDNGRHLGWNKHHRDFDGFSRLHREPDADDFAFRDRDDYYSEPYPPPVYFSDEGETLIPAPKHHISSRDPFLDFWAH